MKRIMDLQLPFPKNKELHYALIIGIYNFYNEKFEVVNITRDDFDIKFCNNSSGYNVDRVYKISYDKYCVVDGVLYERDEHEITAFLRKNKLKKLENKSKRSRKSLET